MSSPTDESGSSLQAPPTFLFDIRKLDVSGEVEQIFVNNHWMPSSHAGDFIRSDPKTLYRWSENSITKEGRPVWYNQCWWADHNTQVVTYKSQSVFWSGNAFGFMTAPNDVSVVGLASNDPPLNNWQQLNFSSDEEVIGLSRIVDVGEEMCLFGTDAAWIKDLGMSKYDEDHVHGLPKATGLVGHLATIIAIVAFSCKEKHLEEVLLHIKAWRKGRWRGHNKGHGRNRERGMLVTIYLDPWNPASTNYALSALEWGNNPILIR